MNDDRYRNPEHYWDPTPGTAIHNAEPGPNEIRRQEEYRLMIDQADNRGRKLIGAIKGILEAAGFDLVTEFVIRDRQTFRTYKGGLKK